MYLKLIPAQAAQSRVPARPGSTRRASSRSASRRSATVLGKQANCQTLVSVTLARHEVAVPLALRLSLPEVWTQDPTRLAEAGVPESSRRHRSKSEIPVAELDRIAAAGV